MAVFPKTLLESVSGPNPVGRSLLTLATEQIIY